MIAFLDGYSKSWAPTSCSPVPILWPPTIRFELHAEMAEEIDLEMCSYGQLSEVQMLRDLDLGSGQGHVNIHSTCRTTYMPNHMTVPLCSTEIWPFELPTIAHNCTFLRLSPPPLSHEAQN